MTAINHKPIDPKALKDALELVARARDQMHEVMKDAPQLGVDFLFRNARGHFRIGEFVFEATHDPTSRTGIFWTVQVTKGKRLIMTAVGTKEAVEQRFRDWHEVLVLLQSHRGQDDAKLRKSEPPAAVKA